MVRPMRGRAASSVFPVRWRKGYRPVGNRVVAYGLLLVVAALLIGPFLWLVSTSLKVGQDLYAYPPQWIPHPFSLGNYIYVWKSLNIPHYLWNTVKMTFWGVAANVVICALAAYPLAKLNFVGKRFVFAAIISIMILPNGAGLIVNFLTLGKLHLVNTLAGVVLPGSVNVINIFLLRQAYSRIPSELGDAARIDGAREWYVFSRVMLPMVRPALATVMILEFMNYWNAFLWPLIVLQNPANYPLAPALAYLQGEFSYNFAYIAAGTVISVIPVILIFIFFQRQFVEGITGSLKG